MAQRMPSTYDIDPDDPRAPTQAEWERMTPPERERVLAMLPMEVPEELMPPEGDRHSGPKMRAREMLDGFFRRVGRKVYVSGELNVFYPGERRFAPDVFAVLDVEPGERDKWLVSLEGKGLDFVLEVHLDGSREKDFRLNVERYARLGIAEYFIFDRGEMRLYGHRLPPGGQRASYVPLVPHQGRFPCEVLGLDLAVEGSRLRFFRGAEPLPDADELITKLGEMVDDLSARRRADAERADLEARRAAELQRQLAEARAEIDRLKRGR